MSRFTNFARNAGGLMLGSNFYRLQTRTRLMLSGDASPILVWQMGKVGSMTIINSLHHNHVPGAMFHVHVLSEHLIETGEVQRRARLEGHKGHLFNQCLREELTEAQQSRRWKIITLVREPLGRNVSSFFQNLDVYFSRRDLAKISDGSYPIERLAEVYFKEFDHDRPLVWFDYEVRDLLGIDVFAVDFPKEQGWLRLTKDNYDLLVLRVEDVERCGEPALCEFLEAPDFRIVNANIDADKSYAGSYRRFRESVLMTDEYIDRMYKSRYARHFYTDGEIAAFQSKWCRSGNMAA